MGTIYKHIVAQSTPLNTGVWDGPGGPVTQASWQCDPEQGWLLFGSWGKGRPDLQLYEDVEQLLFWVSGQQTLACKPHVAL